jgi:hypothetical protein
MDINDELMIQNMMLEEANTVVDEDEHLRIVSTWITSEAKCNSQKLRFEVREKEDQAKSEDGGSLHVIHRLFCRPANTWPK